MLETLAPARRTILGVANNHAADGGPRASAEHCRFLEQRSFEVIGSRDRPSGTINDTVQITSCSFWSNLPCDYVATPQSIARESAGDRGFRILFAHWGYEMQLHPKPRQIQVANDLLRSWNAIVGHHPHCPQPIVEQRGRLAAYSPGNVLFGVNNAKWHHGLVLKIQIGPDSAGRWSVGQVDWSFTCRTPIGDNLFQVDTVPHCRWFPEVPAKQPSHSSRTRP